MNFNIFELGIFSFNSYVYYLTHGFIASTRAFNLLTRAFNLPTRAFSVPIRAFSLATRAFNHLTRGFELVTRGFELVTRVLNSQFWFQYLDFNNWFEITLRHAWSPVNLLHVFRTPFPKITSGWLLLIIRVCEYNYDAHRKIPIVSIVLFLRSF